MMHETTQGRNWADAIKRIVDDPARHAIRFGTVDSVDTKLGLVRVVIQPEGIVTDYIRYVGLGIPIGNWRAMQLPAVDTEVLLLATDPDCYNYIAVAGLYNLVDTPPTDYTAGTILIEHTNGNQLLLDTDGTIYLGGKSGSSGIARKSDLQAVVDYINNTLLPAIKTMTVPTGTGPSGVPINAASFTNAPAATGSTNAKAT